MPVDNRAEMPVKRFLRTYPLAKSALFAGIVTALIFAVSSKSLVFDSFEYWTSDWRTALFSKSLPTQHPRIAVVMINDTTLGNFKYRSPIDRGFIAELVSAIDKTQPAVVGIDLLFDQPTEPEKDQALSSALKAAQAKLVLVALDADTRAEPYQRDYNKKFLSEAGRVIASPAVQTEVDGTVRRRAVAPGGALLFAEAMAREAGSTAVPASRQIAWLRSPPNEDTFQIVFAHDLLPQYSALPAERRESLAKSLKGKVVIIGANLEDRRDSFQTPLSKVSSDSMPGPLVHAQSAAQILDGRYYLSFSASLTYIMTALAAFFGFAIGWRYNNSGFITGVLPLVAFVIVDVICFTQFNLILPFAMPALAWLSGVIAGQWLHGLSDRRQGMASQG